MSLMKLIPPPDSPFAPKGRRGPPTPEDLAEHRPVVPYDDDGEFAYQLGEVHRAAGALIRNPLVDIALAVQALPYKQKMELAVGLRTSPMRLTTWADLVIEAR